jgi:hypothetical protein
MTIKRIGDAPIQDEYRETMKMIAKFVDEMFNGDAKPGERKVAFILMVFPFDDHEGRCNYMSNAERKDVITLLKEQLARFEGSPDVKGTA